MRPSAICPARLTEEVVIGGEMDHGGHVRAEVFADDRHSLPHVLVRRDLDGDVNAAGRRRFGSFAVEADYITETSGEAAKRTFLCRQGIIYQAAENKFFLVNEIYLRNNYF